MVTGATVDAPPKPNGFDDPPDDNGDGPAPNIGAVDVGGVNEKPLVEATGADV